MGCVQSVEHATAPTQAPRISSSPVGGSGRFSNEAAGSQKVPRATSRKRNQVAPAPLSLLEGATPNGTRHSPKPPLSPFELATPTDEDHADTKLQHDQQQVPHEKQQQAHGQSQQQQPVAAAACGSSSGAAPQRAVVETGLTKWESRQSMLRQSWQPFIQELQDLSSRLQADRGEVGATTAKMHALMRRAPEWLDAAASAPSDADAASMLEACARAACALAHCVLAPIVAHAERSLTHAAASSSDGGGSLPRTAARWDTLDVDQLLEALRAGCHAEYGAGVELDAAAAPARLAAELLVMMHNHLAPKRATLLARTMGNVVPALDKIVSMVGIIFFKRVVLEDQAALVAKVQQLGSLRSALGWPDNRHLAACLQPHARAMLAGLHQSADSGGELRANFQVRRGHAFWDALRQAQEQGLLPAGGGSSVMGGKAQCYKVFPSFVDEWASAAGAGGAGHGAKVVLEAGEGHGPRKEFFALAAAGMTGTYRPPTDALHSSGDGRQQQQQQQQEDSQQQDQQKQQHPHVGASEQEQRPSLFTFNRSAGTFWYNATLAESDALRSAYRFAGWLLGQSIVNKAPLEVPLAQPLLCHAVSPGGLDSFVPDLHMLEAHDPAAAAAVRAAAALPAAALRELMDVDGLPADTTAEQYTAHAVRSLLVSSVEWQARALAAGFQSALDVRVLRAWCIDAETLAAVLNEGGDGGGGGDGSSKGGRIDIRKTFRVVMDDELSGNGAVLGDLFWEVVDGWPRERALQLLQFVTGSSRLPLPGSELLKIEAPFVALGLAEHKAQLGMLPQAHTCDNLLELPNYWDALLQVKGYRNASKVPADQLPALKEECTRILDERLTLAITCFSGYGLDVRARNGDDD